MAEGEHAPAMSPDPFPAAPPPRPRIGRRADVNTTFIVACVLVSLLTSLGENKARLVPLFISLWPASTPEALTEVRHGEVWRLFTPAFLHFGVYHLALNMLAMVNLGGPLERVEGPRFYLGFTALIALGSNLAQYFQTGSPAFGGMSGVIFGLFGFLWLRGWVDRRYVLRLQLQGIITTLVWFAFCFTGILPIANTAHAVGLGIGAAWGIVTGLAARRQGVGLPATAAGG